MQHLTIAFVLTSLAGLSTGLGAVVAFFAKRTNYRLLSVCTGLSAGVMLYVSFMEILPGGIAEIARSGLGERWAARLLGAKGWGLLERTARPWRHGELDLVMRRGEVILFVEVKTRASEVFGRPLAAIDRRKRERMRRCATHWLAQRGLLAAPHRFDAVEVVGRPGEGVPRMVWVRRLDMSCAPAPEW